MTWTILVNLCLVLVLLVTHSHQQQQPQTDDGSMYVPLLMPHVQPSHPESYLCTAFRMPRYQHKFIVEYLPNATKETAHHILIFGCQAPGYYERDTPMAVWECGEMSSATSGDATFPTGPVCQGETQIVYSWAMDAPALRMPDGVGFLVGGQSDINYLVLQVHYAHVQRFQGTDATDHSGITLRMLPQDTDQIDKLAGVLLLETGGRVEAHSPAFFDSACRMDEPVEVHPFAFRTHTHKLGKVVAGYSRDPQGRWHLIGKADPQKPQMFYPVARPMTIRPGDMLLARCTMYNYQSHPVQVGPTAEDEMCNFYIMYYVDRRYRHNLSRKICFTPGPPDFYWHHLYPVPEHVQTESSTLIN